MKYLAKLLGAILLIIGTIFLAIYLGDSESFYSFFSKKGSGDLVEVNTGFIVTGKVDIIEEKIKKQSIPLLQNVNFRDVSQKELSMFPKIKINRIPKSIVLKVDLDFTDEFKSLYKSYVLSNGYGFALKVFIDDFDNGGFYNVYRKINGGVGNDLSKGLDGWIVGNELNGGYEWKIPLDQSIKIAVPFEKVSIGYQYKYFDPRDYLVVGKEIPIGVYLSSTKEVPGWKLMKINEFSIEYKGYEDDIILVK